MICYGLIIIGGGASGLIAGINALEKGIKDVLIIDREETLGGNLNLFIHHGFGKDFLGINVTGPEYATILSRKFYELGGECKLGTEVIEVLEDKRVRLINEENGVYEIKGKAIVIATGCREKFTGNVTVPKNKYTDIYTIGAAHRLINFDGYLPGKEAVIMGKKKWALVLARRLTIEGCNVKSIVDSSNNCELQNYKEIIRGFNIDIISNSKIIEVLGDDKIEGVRVQKQDDSSYIIACDSLILSVAYSPNIDIITSIETENKNGNLYPLVNNYQTNIEGIFACGTIIQGEDAIEDSDLDGLKASKYVIEYINLQNSKNCTN